MRDRLRLRALRPRVVAVSTLAVGLVLLVGGAGLTIGLRTVLLTNAVTAAETRSAELVVLVVDGRLAPTVPNAGDDEALVQVVVDGRVVAASANIRGRQPLPVGVPHDGASVRTRLAGLAVGDEDRFEVVSRGVSTVAGPGVVHVGVAVGEIDEVVAEAARVGLLGLPLLLAALALLLWQVVGRTLAPVDAIRAQADAIDIRGLGQRLPLPPGEDEVTRLVRTINGMLDRIENGVLRQRRFVGDAAHELRTPIATLRTQLETARASGSPVDWEAVGDDLLAETLRMQRLTEQLLVLARLDAGELRRRSGAVDLDDLAESVADVLRATAGDLRLDASGLAPVQVRGDPVLLELVVRNLLENAVRHARTQVSISTAHDGPDAVLRVDDDGPGIPAPDRDRVFDRFVRVDEARDRRSGGAGLGLALVADVVEAHAGVVRATASTTLGGARLEVRLPADA